MSAAHDFGPFQLGGAVRFAGKRPDIDNSGTAVTLDSYTVVDLTAQYRITRTVSLFGRIENAGNAHYETASGYDQQPRSAFVGVKWQGGL